MITLMIIIFLLATILYLAFGLGKIFVIYILPIILIKKIYDKKSKSWDEEKTTDFV